jgi:hypothetical protein
MPPKNSLRAASVVRPRKAERILARYLRSFGASDSAFLISAVGSRSLGQGRFSAPQYHGPTTT